jgi:hypothetical protein
MRITKIEHLQDKEDWSINEIISNYENKGFEVVQISTAATQSDYTPHTFITIVFQKEQNK